MAFKTVSALVAVGFFTFGFQFAIGAPARIIDLSLSEQEDHSTLSITTDITPDLAMSFDTKTSTLTARLVSVTGENILDDLKYSDKLIKSVSAVKEEKTGDVLIKIAFHKPNITFNRASLPGEPGITLNFRSTEKPLRITGVTPEKLMAAIARPAGEKPSKEKTVEPTAPKTEQPAGETMEKKPASIEPVAAKAPVKKPVRSERELAELAELDKEYKKIENNSGREQYIELMKKIQKGEFAEAVDDANRFMKYFPLSIYRERVLYSKAEALYRIAKKDMTTFNTAITAANEAIASAPDSYLAQPALMHKASLLADQELYTEALAEYGGLLRLAPKGKYIVTAMLSRAQIYMKQEKFQKAYNELEKILILFPAHRKVRDAKYLIAESHYHRGNYKIAGTIFNEALKQWPTYPKTHPATYIRIAETNYRLGKKKQAIEDWYSIVNLFPKSFEARKSMLWIGDTLVDMNKKLDAAKIFERTARRYPKNDEAVMASMRLATLGAENPKLLKHSEIFDYHAFERPFETFNEIIKRYPDKQIGQDALVRKGKAFSDIKRSLSAIMAFKELLRTYPGYRMSEEVFGLVRSNFLEMINTYYEQDGFFIVLMTYYNNFDPFLRGIENPEILVKIADSYSHMTLYDRAIEYFRLANKFDPDKKLLPKTAFNIAMITLKKKNYEEAKSMLRLYLRQFPRSSYTTSARHLLGDAFYKTGEATQAVTEWRMAVETNPGHPRTSRSLYNMGLVYKGKKQYAMAIDSFNRAIDTFSPTVNTGEDPIHIKNSVYLVAETYYLDRDFPNAIREANAAKRRYNDDKRNIWMDYLISSSLERINKDEQAIARLKDMSEQDKDLAVAKVAMAKLKAFEWRRKNESLFVD